MKIKPYFVYDDEKKKIAVSLQPQDFKLMVEELEDYEDHLLFEERLKKIKNIYPAEYVRKQIFGKK